MTDRLFEDYIGSVNVKDYGALGDNSTNDTAAIQLAINAAFGSGTSPNGDNDYLNKSLRFPRGRYVISPYTTNKTITNITSASSITTYTLNSVTGLVVGRLVHFHGAVCNGNLMGTRRIATINTGASTVTVEGTHTFVNYTSGGICIIPCLELTNVQLAHVFGESGAKLMSSGGIAMLFDGFYKTTVRNLHFVGPGSGVAGSKGLVLDMHGGNTGGFVGSQGATTYDCFIHDFETDMEIGPTNLSQSSETSHYNLHTSNCVDGVVIGRNVNQNCLQHQFYGGNSQACTHAGIWAPWGSAPIIAGMGFQNFNATDIKIDNTAADTMIVSGCRTETKGCFVSCNLQQLRIIGCTQTAYDGGSGAFLQSQSSASIEGCVSHNGTVQVWEESSIYDSEFGHTKASWIVSGSGNPVVHIQNVLVGNIRGGAGADDPSTLFGLGVYKQPAANGTFYFIGKKSGTRNETTNVFTDSDLVFADLPTAAAAFKGLMAFISDSNQSTLGGTAAGGGSVIGWVVCNGTNWTQMSK